ncbi:hypothetical protein Syun_012956 [Stephania yunnanensis]|uniref:Uncharacterized protein n=1 Tax=Stephania yunnanensis TaxID=152371 RepID=A0AAP0K0G8_9MAGN
MVCKVNSSSNPQFFSKCSNKPPKLLSSSCPKSQSIQMQRLNSMSFRCCYNQNKQQQPITTKTQQSKPELYSVNFKTMKDCNLGISIYPNFVYNAGGGRGTGRGTLLESQFNELFVSFDLQTLYIPPLNSNTTKFLALPLPPFFKIDIVPQLFQGTIEKQTGKVSLEFKAKFCFSVGSVYRAPPLLVETILTSEESSGKMRSGKGERLDEEGKCRLVGVAIVDPIDDVFMNSFLRLPTECLAVLNATIQFSAST